MNADLSGERLQRLIVSGNIVDQDLVNRTERLNLLFHSAAHTSPAPLWAPGLKIEREWRAVTETFLPWSEIAPAFRRLISRSLRYSPVTDPLAHTLSWPNFLDRHACGTTSVNPAQVLARLINDDNLRKRWLFNLFLPKEHGNGFCRYPAQKEYLRAWLTNRCSRHNRQISCYDAACGSGEGTWDLMMLCHECGIMPEDVTINGSSLEPLEIFAAAHAAFPHDLSRERQYRDRISPLLTHGYGARLAFFQEDLTNPRRKDGRYDLIICNGILGGPLLHESTKMERVMATMVTQLRSGGLFLATDRFHEGWLKLTPNRARENLLTQYGLKIREIGDGICGEKM